VRAAVRASAARRQGGDIGAGAISSMELESPVGLSPGSEAVRMQTSGLGTCANPALRLRPGSHRAALLGGGALPTA